MKDVVLIIDGKMHKLMEDELVLCTNCSLYQFCSGKLIDDYCPAGALGGEYFVELKVEK